MFASKYLPGDMRCSRLTRESWDQPISFPWMYRPTLSPKPDTVSVAGEVYNPTNLVYNREKPQVRQYLALTGGPTKFANEKEMYILRADGTVFSRSRSGHANVWLSSFEDTPLYPGDTLVVPPKLLYTRLKTEVKDISSIIYEMAVSAGVIINQVFR